MSVFSEEFTLIFVAFKQQALLTNVTLLILYFTGHHQFIVMALCQVPWVIFMSLCCIN